MPADFKSWIEAAMAPAATPGGCASREIVRRAIEFDDPPRIPYSFVMPVRGDFFETAALESALARAATGQRPPGEIYVDEWGVTKQATGGTWDRVTGHPLAAARDLARYVPPRIDDPTRFDRLAPFVRRAREAGKYVVGGDPVLLYERLQALMGFEPLMVAPYTHPQELAVLLDRLADATISAIEHLARVGADGFMTWQDLAEQSGLHMRPDTFREFYRPRFERMVRAAHDRGLHVIWHACGQVLDLIPELIEIGVDVIQLDQPRVVGHQELAGRFGGKVCFWNTVDIQWAARPEIGEDELRNEVLAMTEPFRRFRGGFMARHYPYPRDIGLTEDFHRVTAEAFLSHGAKAGASG